MGGAGGTMPDAGGTMPDASMQDSGEPDAEVDAGGEDDTALFVPSFESTHVGADDGGLKIVAHTLGEGSLGAEWLVAVENQGTLKLCAITVDLTFFDAGGNELASGFIGLETPMHLGCNGTCGLTTGCLSPGQTGMGVGLTLINDIDVTQIASVEHTFSGLQLVDAVPTTDIVASGITPELN
jgi:hypothetical protein